MARLSDILNDLTPGEFAARPIYNPDGDFISYFFRDEDAYAHRVDELLTVYHSRATDELVGCKIKGVRRILETLGNFGFTLSDGHITLGMLFLAGMAATRNVTDRGHYEKFGRETRGVPLDVAELQLV